jgi:hypothetical protein
MLGRFLWCISICGACLGADISQCTRIAALPEISASSFRVFQGKWVLGDGKVFISTNNGSLWTQVLGYTPPQVPQLPPGGTIVGPFDGKLFVIPRGGEYRYILSTTDGTHWTQTSTPVVVGFFASVGDTWVITAGMPTAFDVRISRDAGQHWVVAPSLDPLGPPSQVFGPIILRTGKRILLFDGRVPQTGYSLTRVRRLSPNAERWEDVTPCDCVLAVTGLDDSGLTDEVLAVSVHRVDSGGERFLLVTTDAATSWTFQPQPPPGSIRGFSQGIVAEVYGNTSNKELFLFSPDSGRSWRPMNDGLPASRQRLGPIGTTVDKLMLADRQDSSLWACTLR